jgi:hypothetical protein
MLGVARDACCLDALAWPWFTQCAPVAICRHQDAGCTALPVADCAAPCAMQQAPSEHRDHRACGPRQDHADGRHHQGQALRCVGQSGCATWSRALDAVWPSVARWLLPLRSIPLGPACFRLADCSWSLATPECALLWLQVLSEQGQAKAVAFNEIDKAPEEKARGITIATVSAPPLLGTWPSPSALLCSLSASLRCLRGPRLLLTVCCAGGVCRPMWSTRRISATTPTWTVPATLTTSR